MDKALEVLLLGALALALGAALSAIFAEAAGVGVGRVPAALFTASIFALLVASVVGIVRIICG